jgi:hypothetical protein
MSAPLLVIDASALVEALRRSDQAHRSEGGTG